MTQDEGHRRRDVEHALARNGAIATSLWRSGVECSPTPEGVHLSTEVAERLAHFLAAAPCGWAQLIEGATPWPARPSSPSSAT